MQIAQEKKFGRNIICINFAEENSILYCLRIILEREGMPYIQAFANFLVGCLLLLIICCVFMRLPCMCACI